MQGWKYSAVYLCKKCWLGRVSDNKSLGQTASQADFLLVYPSSLSCFKNCLNLSIFSLLCQICFTMNVAYMDMDRIIILLSCYLLLCLGSFIKLIIYPQHDTKTEVMPCCASKKSQWPISPPPIITDRTLHIFFSGWQAYKAILFPHVPTWTYSQLW